MKKAKSGGFTLLELLLVIVISGIVMGFIYLSVANVSSSAARRAATEMNYAIFRCRSGAVSREGFACLELSVGTQGEILCKYYENGALAEERELGGSRVTVSLSVDEGEKPLTSAAPLYLSFERGTGAESTLNAAAERMGKSNSYGGGYCSAITFSGGRGSYTVEIVASTGSHGIQG